ncbi:mediator complex subunit Med20 [Orbilia blumenaviensis]|uniref:Mediator of RNA polymerase II transcription subunit 20 n=1 Tax=Orbilia blumenaviensis TaxID=1796055 RepID=A0AAV9V8T1_9PEZI
MPVTGLYFCPDSGTTQAPHAAIFDRLSKRYQPTITSKWSLEHRLLRENGSSSSTSSTPSLQAPVTQTPPQTRYMQYLDLSFHPGKRFCLVDKSLVTIDPDFEHILTAKLQGLWGMRQTLKAEGTSLELEDFKIKIAPLSQGSMIKGVLMEVEYLPCSYLEQGEAVIRDFIEQLELPSGPNVRLYFSQAPVPVGVDGNDEPREFSILDTGMQYMELLRLR